MALFLESTAPRMGIWKIEESTEELYARLNRKEEYLPFLDRVKAEKRRAEWLASRVLLKQLLGEEVRIAYRPDGAPFLPDHPLHLSISHTNGYAAVLLQAKEAVGIDIEYRAERVKKIRSRFMSAEEEAGIDLRHETEMLLIHWCAKEALFKMIGQTDVDFQKHLHVSPFPYAGQGIIDAWETRTETQAAYRLHYHLFPEFVLVYSL